MSTQNKSDYSIDLLWYMEMVETEEQVKKDVVRAFQREFGTSFILACWADKLQAMKELEQTTMYDRNLRGLISYAKSEEETKKQAEGKFDLDLSLQFWREKEARWSRMNELRHERERKAQAEIEAQREERRKAKQAQVEARMAEISRQWDKPKTPPKDQSADKRAEYAQKIMFKEQEMDDLGQLERNFENRNDKFISNTNRFFEEFEETFHEGSSYSSQQSHWQQSVVQEAYHHMKSLAEQQNDTMKN
ncbi:MAG: hypothetical protein LBI13_02835, partial [Streptococcaceae bacterium]|nr:hypothetical protein [Streptococcaceae bacterium]